MLDPRTRQVVAKSERFLNTGRWALENGDPESAASRTYYALYHMTILLLRLVRGRFRVRWDHDQLNNAFLDEFCKPGFRFSRRDGDDWGYIKGARLQADYGRPPLAHRRAQRSLERAEQLIAKKGVEVERNA